MIRPSRGSISLGAFFLSTLFLASSYGSEEVNTWKFECIGRYQIKVPGEIEVAFNKLNHDGASSKSVFSDGIIAPYSKLDYVADISIFSPATEADFIKYKNIILTNRKETKNIFLNSSDETHQRWGRNLKDITYNTPSLFGWDSEDNSPRLTFLLNNKIYSFSFVNNDNSDKEQNKKYFNFIMNGFRPRPIYEIPKQPGVCIPYGFIADDDIAPRNIGVTMRLIDHPDIEIFFQDSSYQLSPGEHSDSKQEILLFLDQYARKQKYVDTGFWGTHSIQMSGQKGRGNFFTIARSDDSIDYGFIASVKGDFSSAIDTPSQMLFITRTASRAKGNPVNKDELKDIAEKIMASIKRHPVQ